MNKQLRYYPINPVTGRRMTFIGNFDSDNTLRISWAECSFQDQFSRKKGVDIATKRQQEGYNTCSIFLENLHSSPTNIFIEECNYIMSSFSIEDLASDYGTNVPTYTKKLRQWQQK